MSTSITPSHTLAIHDLLEAMRTDSLLRAGIDMALQNLLQGSEVLTPYVGLLRDFLLRVMSLDALRAPLTDMYASRFSETEIGELLAFYHSPVGRRMALEGPSLTADAATLGQRAVQERLPDLQALIEQQLALED